MFQLSTNTDLYRQTIEEPVTIPLISSIFRLSDLLFCKSPLFQCLLVLFSLVSRQLFIIHHTHMSTRRPSPGTQSAFRVRRPESGEHWEPAPLPPPHKARKPLSPRRFFIKYTQWSIDTSPISCYNLSVACEAQPPSPGCSAVW